MSNEVSESPELVFDKKTGRLYLTDGVCRRVFARVNKRGEILVLWRTPGEKREHVVKVEDTATNSSKARCALGLFLFGLKGVGWSESRANSREKVGL